MFQIAKDQRLRISNALYRANLHLTDYGRQIILKQLPPTVPRKDTMSTAFRFVFQLASLYQSNKNFCAELCIVVSYLGFFFFTYEHEQKRAKKIEFCYVIFRYFIDHDPKGTLNFSWTCLQDSFCNVSFLFYQILFPL